LPFWLQCHLWIQSERERKSYLRGMFPVPSILPRGVDFIRDADMPYRDVLKKNLSFIK
jgi:hypothetical protein